MRIDELKKIAEENNYEYERSFMRIHLRRTVEGCLNEITINTFSENRLWISMPKKCFDEDFNMVKAAIDFTETDTEDREREKEMDKERNLEETNKLYIVFDSCEDIVRFVCKSKTLALARIGEDVLNEEYVDEYQIIEIDLDEVEDED